MRGPEASQGEGGQGGRGGPGGGQFQPTEEMTNRMLDRLAESDPEKAKDLRQLKSSDPEKFKAEFTKAMQSMFGSRRGGNQGARGNNAGPGRGQDQ